MPHTHIFTVGDATMMMGDALEVLPDLREVDAIITDPPYCSGSVSESGRSAAKGQGLRSENLKKFGWFVGDNMGTAGLAFLLRAMGFAGLQALKPSGHVLVFCDWRMVPNLAPAIESAGLRYQNLVVWNKGAMGLGAGFRAQHELILHYTAGAPEYHDLGTANVLQAGRISASEREHQTQKPVDLLMMLARVVSPPGGLIVDPFAGSGSTGVAALQLGRRFIGIERDPEHFETACRRLQEAHAARPLFTETEPAIAQQAGLDLDAAA